MKDAYTRLGESRFREARGLFLEELNPGLVIEHRPGRTITMTDNIWSSLLAMNLHPLHIDAHYAAGTEFGRIVVSSLVTFGIVNGMTVHSLSQNAIANLGWDKVRLVSPVFVGDTLYAESQILTRRPSKSRPHQGIVCAETIGQKEDGTEVIRFERTFLVATAADLDASPYQDGPASAA